MTDYRSLIERKLEPISNSGKEIIYLCPDCNDKSGHLYVNYDKNVFHCVRCGYAGRSLSKLARKIGLDVSYDYGRLYSEHEKELDEILSSPKRVEATEVLDYSTDLSSLTEYYNLHCKMLSFEAYSYLLNRGISPESILKYGLCEGVNRYGEIFTLNGKEYMGRDYSGRILVPSLRRDGRVSYFVARDYIGGKSAKYLNPPKELGASSEDVYNLDIIETKSVIICEGTFTALAINQALGKCSAVATYGKSIANRSSDLSVRVTSQGEKLIYRNLDNYIMFYDKDALSEAYTNASYLHTRGACVKVVHVDPEGKYSDKADAADMTPDEIISHIKEAVEFDVLSELA